MLHQRYRLQLPCSLDEWLDAALVYPGVQLLSLSRTTAVESCRLPGELHRDPVDRMLVAASREFECPLMTMDRKILDYPYVTTIRPDEFSAGEPS